MSSQARANLSLILVLLVTASGAFGQNGSTDKLIGPSTARADAPGAPQPSGAKGAAASLDKRAPDFLLADLGGKQVKLSDYAGKIVVLEWFNPDCPFIKFAHSKGPLRNMAQELAGKDIVWFAINSGGKDRQGHGVERNRTAAKQFGIKHPILLDESGKVGKLYGAKSTPHMFIIDSKGVLAYVGALDNAPLGAIEGNSHINYVANAIKELRSGKRVSVSKTNAYGCSVKYAR
ncbi:MAG: redoxin domain-containing protein [Myxococcales bacterium]|nr:redoxin domain-containing protein [Myxococcales bacterium]